MTIIFAGLVLIPVVLFLPESYSPILLYWNMVIQSTQRQLTDSASTANDPGVGPTIGPMKMIIVCSFCPSHTVRSYCTGKHKNSAA
jgi:hypothetical protein